MWLGRDGCAIPTRGLVTHKGAGGMGLSHGTPRSGRFYPDLEAERKADSLLTHAPGPLGLGLTEPCCPAWAGWGLD